MTFNVLSPKQKQVFKWCYKDDYKAIICDGAVRSGKTICMITSFILWAMRRFDGSTFGVCGKTVRSAERNIIMPLQSIVDITAYFKVSYTRSANLLTIEGCGHKNYFYVFGGKDESSYTLIQGITLAGVLLDEVALMPRSFVEQALARCSVNESKLWFNCNPESSEHWFYKEWVDDNSSKAKYKNRLHLHFTMEDNYSLTNDIRERYRKLYTGVFYDRYIKGMWVLADGLVYSAFDKAKHVLEDYKPTADALLYISCDYGTVNPFSAGLWALEPDKAVRLNEYYYNGRELKTRKTDEEYYREIEKLAGNADIQFIIVDPSASSFIECIKRHGKFRVRHADNRVLDGIRATNTLIDNHKIFINSCCTDILREFTLYQWDEKSKNDSVIKENDHAMDDMRYFVNNVLSGKLLRALYREGGVYIDKRSSDS